MSADWLRAEPKTPQPANRLPDFVIVGTMKSGSTTLWRWLGQHPEVDFPRVKEPNFFSHDHVWRRGLAWYQDLFAEVPRGIRTGEASVTYTDPTVAGKASERLHRTTPDMRLVCVLRHPVERLRSHYRHEVQRGRERRPLTQAIASKPSPYIERSCYAACLAPWVERFGRERLLVFRLEDLVGPDDATWYRLLHHLGVATTPRPGGAFNVTAEKARFTGPLRFLWEKGLLPSGRHLPRPVRTVARRILLRKDSHYLRLLAQADADLPEESMRAVWNDVAQLPALLGDERLCWHDRRGT